MAAVHSGNTKLQPFLFQCVFADGSGLWEKRADDWFLADPETIAAAQEGH
jgi:hypothetical protein